MFLDVLQMKEDVLKFLATGTHLGGTHLGFWTGRYIYKRKSDGTRIVKLEGPWELLLQAAHAIVAIENRLRSVSHAPGILASRLCLSLRLPLEPRLLVATSLLELLLTRSRQTSGSWNFWLLLVPGPTARLSWRHIMWTSLSLLCKHRHSSALCRYWPSVDN